MSHAVIDRRQLMAGLGATVALTGLTSSGALAFALDGESWPIVRSFVPGFVAQYPIPCALVTVGRGQEVPHHIADGVLAIDSDQRVDEHSLWRIYSMTKPITGMATMMLIEDGLLALDQDVGEILPAFANPRVLTDPDNSLDSRSASGPITIRHLLTHTAGLGYSIVSTGPLLAEYQRLGLEPGVIMHEPAEDTAHRPSSLEEFADRLATVPIIADPGTRWSYSVATDLLGRVIEVASGMPFDTFLQQRLFGPLGMNDTFFQLPADKADRMTANYTVRDGQLLVVDPGQGSVYQLPPRYPYGGAGLVSSAHDYDRFLMMLLGEGTIGDTRIMSTETAQLAMSDLLLDGVDKSAMFVPSGFGAAGRVSDSPGSPPGSGGNFGWGGAAGTIAWVDRGNNFRVSGYVQNIPGELSPFRDGVMRAVYGDLQG